MTNAVVHLRRRLSSASSGDKVHFQLVDMAPHCEAASLSLKASGCYTKSSHNSMYCTKCTFNCEAAFPFLKASGRKEASLGWDKLRVLVSPPLKSLFKGPPPSLLGIPLRGWEWGTPMNKLHTATSQKKSRSTDIWGSQTNRQTVAVERRFSLSAHHMC